MARLAQIAIATFLSSLVAGGAAAQAPTCEVQCPEGTRLTNFGENVLREAATGSFIWVEASCEASCAPIVPCVWPNAPVVTPESGFRCEPLPGFSTLEPDSEVDLSFGARFDPERADPLRAGKVVIGGAFDLADGTSVVLAALTLDGTTVTATAVVEVVQGGFAVDLSDQVPLGEFTLAYFVDDDGDLRCAGETVYRAVVVGQGANAYLYELILGDPEHLVADELCPRIEESL